MKVIAFNGSPKKNGNTSNSLRVTLETLERHGIETELVQVGGKLLHGCSDCGYCAREQNRTCAFKDDEMNDFIQKAAEADGILIGSPVYFSMMTPETKALIDRLGRVSRANDFFLKHKAGAAVVAVRRAGSNLTFAAINMLFGISGMYTVGSSYWNMTLSLAPGDWQKDAEGIATFTELGENMAFLLEKLNG